MALKVVVNVSLISPPLTGIGRYSRSLLEVLLNSGEVSNLDGITPYKRLDKEKVRRYLLACDEFSSRPSTDSIIVNIKRAIKQKIQSSASIYELRRLVEHNAVKLRDNYDSGSIFWDPGFLKLPINLPSITTVYDLSHIAYPECHPKARVKLLERNLSQSIEHSDRIVTISEFSKQEIIAAFGVDEGKIFLVPPGVSEEFRIPPSASKLLEVSQQYSLPKRFILSICTLEPRKNLISLIHAFCLLPKVLRRSYPLVLVGSQGWHDNEMTKLLDTMERAGEAILVGYVSQHNLPIFYRLANIFVYVSVYEGYGMPIAEAMASGTAVITSNCSSMPEVANGACVLVDPLDEHMISQAIQQLIEDDQLRHTNIELGLTRSQDYTWESSSIKLIKAMRSLC